MVILSEKRQKLLKIESIFFFVITLILIAAISARFSLAVLGITELSGYLTFFITILLLTMPGVYLYLSRGLKSRLSFKVNFVIIEFIVTLFITLFGYIKNKETLSTLGLTLPALALMYLGLLLVSSLVLLFAYWTGRLKLESSTNSLDSTTIVFVSGFIPMNFAFYLAPLFGVVTNEKVFVLFLSLLSMMTLFFQTMALISYFLYNRNKITNFS